MFNHSGYTQCSETTALEIVMWLEPNSTTRTPAIRTPATNTTNEQKFAASQRLDMSRCWALALRCGKFVVELLWACLLLVSVAGVRVVEFGSYCFKSAIGHEIRTINRTVKWNNGKPHNRTRYMLKKFTDPIHRRSVYLHPFRLFELVCSSWSGRLFRWRGKRPTYGVEYSLHILVREVWSVYW